MSSTQRELRIHANGQFNKIGWAFLVSMSIAGITNQLFLTINHEMKKYRVFVVFLVQS